MLFLLYSGLLFLILGGLCLAVILCNEFAWSSITFAVLALPGFVMGFAVGSFGCSYIPHVCINRTTLERIARVAGERFDRGAAENFRQVFGKNCCHWFVPTKPAVSGFMWSGITDLDALVTARGSTCGIC
jgi:hypothetical protein